MNTKQLPTNDYNFLSIFNCKEITKSGREKHFIIPKNVNFYCIHIIVSGKKCMKINPEDAYFNHYFFLNKSHRGREKCSLQDRTILKHCGFIKS